MASKSSKNYLIFLTIVIVAYLYSIRNSIELILEGSIEDAQIVSCESKQNSKMGIAESRSNYLSYYQIAVSASGEKALGFPFLPKEDLCLKSIGKNVQILISADSPEKNRINTFFNFWMLPYLGLYLVLTLGISGFLGSSSISINILLVIAGLFYYLEFYV